MITSEVYFYRATRAHAVIYFNLTCDYTACCAVIHSMGQSGWASVRLNSDGSIFKPRPKDCA